MLRHFLVGDLEATTFVVGENKNSGKIPVAVTLENLKGSTEVRCLLLTSWAFLEFDPLYFGGRNNIWLCKGSSGTIEEVFLSVFPSQKGSYWAGLFYSQIGWFSGNTRVL